MRIGLARGAAGGNAARQVRARAVRERGRGHRSEAGAAGPVLAGCSRVRVAARPPWVVPLGLAEAEARPETRSDSGSSRATASCRIRRERLQGPREPSAATSRSDRRLLRRVAARRRPGPGCATLTARQASSRQHERLEVSRTQPSRRSRLLRRERVYSRTTHKRARAAKRANVSFWAGLGLISKLSARAPGDRSMGAHKIVLAAYGASPERCSTLSKSCQPRDLTGRVRRSTGGKAPKARARREFRGKSFGFLGGRTFSALCARRRATVRVAR